MSFELLSERVPGVAELFSFCQIKRPLRSLGVCGFTGLQVLLIAFSGLHWRHGACVLEILLGC